MAQVREGVNGSILRIRLVCLSCSCLDERRCSPVQEVRGMTAGTLFTMLAHGLGVRRSRGNIGHVWNRGIHGGSCRRRRFW